MSYFIFDTRGFGDEYKIFETEEQVTKYLTEQYNKKKDFAEDAVVIKGDKVNFQSRVTTEVKIEKI
jgi:hypothetical protein